MDEFVLDFVEPGSMIPIDIVAEIVGITILATKRIWYFKTYSLVYRGNVHVDVVRN